MMERVGSVRWRTPFPTSVDEELAAYDDGTVWLVVRCSRDGAATVGTWSTTPRPDDHAALAAAGDVVVELLDPGSGLEVAEKLRIAALATPLATAQFLAARGEGETITLAAVGGGTRAIEFELDPDTVTVHVEKDDDTTVWFEARKPITGFITPDAAGLGGLGRRAEIAPGAFGAIVLDVPGVGSVTGDDVTVQLSGWLADGLPDQPEPRPFRVRAAAVERYTR
jgi:hypothetical protein